MRNCQLYRQILGTGLFVQFLVFKSQYGSYFRYTTFVVLRVRQLDVVVSTIVIVSGSVVIITIVVIGIWSSRSGVFLGIVPNSS